MTDTFNIAGDAPVDRAIAQPPAGKPEDRLIRAATSPVQAENGGYASEHAGLFSDDDAAAFRDRWDSIQASFVDEPQQAVQDADKLVEAVTAHLAERFGRDRAELESQWGRGAAVSTEDLRMTLQRYRGFFGRLLAL